MPTGVTPTWSLPYQSYSISVSAPSMGWTTRSFVVGLPANYAPSQGYPVVFTWHAQNGTAEDVVRGGTFAGELYSGFYGLRYLSTQANLPIIFVSGQGLPTPDGGTNYGWRRVEIRREHQSIVALESRGHS